MKNKTLFFKTIDFVLIILTVLPLLIGILLKILYSPSNDGISITGALIYFTLTVSRDIVIPITESQINSWLVIISIFWLCIFLTHGLKKKCVLSRQHIAEWIVEKTNSLVSENMGDFFSGFSPFIGAVTALSAFSSLISLLGLYPPTSDLNVVAGWSLLVFLLITHYKLKGGLFNYLTSFSKPAVFLTPLNVISEIATPVSMAFRHYGNILSGSVISSLIASALYGLSVQIFGRLPGFLGKIPFFQIGLTAVFSIYFDVFSGLLQAFIFSMLTMLYISGGFPADIYKKRQIDKQKNN